MINVLIADELPAMRNELQSQVEALVERLGEECVVAHTDDGLKTFRKAKRLQPDLILMSSTLPYSGGLQVVLALKHYSPNAKLVMMMESPNANATHAYVEAGVHGLVHKHRNCDELSDCVCTVLRGERYFAPLA